ncbi:hypothetical protein [Veillonella rodentium]|nr:hypothetical protein [Veillonella rodentium]
MGKKWIMKYIKILLIIISLCTVSFILIFNYLFSDNRFNTSEIYYDTEEKVLSNSKSDGVIARDVYGMYEIENKIYYITSYGYGIYDEHTGENSIVKYTNESTIPADVKLNFNRGYLSIKQLDVSEQDTWSKILNNEIKSQHNFPDCYVVKYPFYLSGLQHKIIELNTGKSIGRYSEFSIQNNAFYFVDFGTIGKIDLDTNQVYKFYTSKLLISKFSKEPGSDGFKNYLLEILEKERLKDKELLDNHTLSILLVNNFSEFNGTDQSVFSTLIDKMVRERKALDIGKLNNVPIVDYLNE